jgi:hypothetical protein
MSKRDAAIKLAAAGFRVFPLAINGKTPAITGDWQVVATKDPDKVARLWTDPIFESEVDYNIGIALERSHLVVDVDTRGDKQGAKSLATLEAINDPLPPTYEVITASGGRHLYYLTDDSTGAPKELAKHVDLKGYGGYVVGPGSEIDGRFYRPSDGRDGFAVERLPEWIRDDIQQRRHVQDRVVHTDGSLVTLDTDAAIKRAQEWLLTKAPTAVEGDNGSLTTYKVAAQIKDFGVSQSECSLLMIEHWNDTKAQPPWSMDELDTVIGNAYKYGTSAPGKRNPEAEFEAVAINETRVTLPKRGLYVVNFADAKPDFDRPYLIEDVVDLAAMVVTYGDSNVGKTFVALDQAYAIAAGEPWNGHKVTTGLVVYVAAEGGRGFMKRVAALRVDRKKVDLPLAIVPCPIDLHSAGEGNDTGRLIRLVRAEEARCGQKCVLLVIDTLARAMGGGDENTAVDMGILVGHCDRLRAALGCTINVIHHTGKDKAKGARGSSALRAATDTEIEIDEGRLSIQKQRDLDPMDDMVFELRSVEVGRRPSGKAVTSCVVEWLSVSEFESRLSPIAQQMDDHLKALIQARRDEIMEDDKIPEDEKMDLCLKVSIPWKEWEMSCLSGIVGVRNRPVNRRRLFEVRPELCESGRTKKDHKNQWYRVDSANSAN